MTTNNPATVEALERFLLGALHNPGMALNSDTYAAIARNASAPAVLRKAADWMYRVFYAPKIGQVAPVVVHEVKRGAYIGAEALRDVVSAYSLWCAEDREAGIGESVHLVEIDRADASATREGEALASLNAITPILPKGHAQGKSAQLEYLRAARREASADYQSARESYDTARRLVRKAKLAADSAALKSARAELKEAREAYKACIGTYRHYRNSMSGKQWAEVCDRIKAGTYKYRPYIETRADKDRQRVQRGLSEAQRLIGALELQRKTARTIGSDYAYLSEAIARLARHCETLKAQIA